MLNAFFVRHPVLSLPHRHPPPALACSHPSTPLSSTDIAVRGSRRKPPQSLSPICCLRRLLLLSLIAVVSHLVSSLPRRHLPPALACRHPSTPATSVDIAVRGSRRKPPPSSSPIRCLRRLSSLSLVAVVSRRRLSPFRFIIRRRRRYRRFLSRHRHISC